MYAIMSLAMPLRKFLNNLKNNGNNGRKCGKQAKNEKVTSYKLKKRIGVLNEALLQVIRHCIILTLVYDLFSEPS